MPVFSLQIWFKYWGVILSWSLPILQIMGENAHSRYFSEHVYEMAAEPKELFIVPKAGHVDLYDKTDLIPFDKLQKFFEKNLK